MAIFINDSRDLNVVGKQLCSNVQPCKHVTVFGGTQVGKSTCLNVILEATVARVHQILRGFCLANPS